MVFCKHTREINKLKFLLPLLLVTSCASFEADTVAQIVAAVAQHFHSGCIHIVHSQDQNMNQQKMVVEEAKHLWKNQLSVALLTHSRMSAALHSSRCHRNRPLCAITQNPKNVVHFLVELRNIIWLMFLDTSSVLEELFTTINIPFDCEFLVAQLKGGLVVLTEVYRVSPSLPLQSYGFGNWTSAEGLTGPTLSLNQRRNNFQGLALRVGTINESYVRITKVINKKPTDVSGYFGEIWHLLERRLMFKSDYYRPSDNSFGSDLGNGSWTGLVGLLTSNQVNITIGDMFWNKQRTYFVDFVTPIEESRSYMFVRNSDSSDVVWNTLLKPLSSTLWLALSLTIVILSLCLWMTEKFLRYFKIQVDGGGYNWGFLEYLLRPIRAFCSQAQEDCSPLAADRIVYLTMYLTAVVMLTSYSASLISYIMTQVYELPFNNFQEFLKDGTYKLGALAGSAQVMYFKMSTNPMLIEVYRKHIAPHESSLPTSLIESLEMICNRREYASMISSAVPPAAFENIKCSVQKVPQAFMAGPLSMAMQKNSPYLRLFKLTLRNMQRNGLFRVLRKRNVRDRITNNDMEFRSVLLTEVTPILVIVAVGVIAAILLLVVENLSC